MRASGTPIQKALALTDGVKTIVDLPCGTGRFTGHLARAGYEVVGSDISVEMMQQAAKLPAVTRQHPGYVRADAEALPFAAKSVDCVMSIRFLFHVDPRNAAAHAARVRPRVATLGHRRLPAQVFVSLRRMEVGARAAA